jgi:hypothetical protein
MHMSHARARGRGFLGKKDPRVPQCFRLSDGSMGGGGAVPPQALLCSSERHGCSFSFSFSFSMASASASTSTQAPAQAGKSMQPLIAQGDWTKNLVQLAKTAELK